MARTTGPIVAAGAITWANQTLLNDFDYEDMVEITTRIGVATGILAGIFYGFEKISGDVAVGFAWVALTTTLLVRYKNKPTPLERVLDLIL